MTSVGRSTAPSQSTSGSGRTWESFHLQLHSTPGGLAPEDQVGQNRPFINKYLPKTDKTFAVSSRVFASASPQVNFAGDCLSQNISYLYAFNNNERLGILQCVDVLGQAEAKDDMQKTLILWCKILKESVGDFPFHLLLQSQSSVSQFLPSDSINGLSFFGKKLMQILGFAVPPLNPTPAIPCAPGIMAEFIGVIQKLTQLTDSMDLVLPPLERFSRQQITLNQFSQELDQLREQIDRERFPEKNLDELYDEFSNTTSQSVKFPLSQDQLSFIFQQYRVLDSMGKTLKNSDLRQWVAQAQEIRQRYTNRSATPDDLLMLLAIGREALKFKYGVYPYNTQMLTILGLIAHPDQFKGRIAQVRTGEGKSLIITLLAFVYASQGNSVDIVSSSRYLAQRDAEKYAPFFNEFNIATSHICLHEPEDKHFRGQVVYGTNYDFEFALMRDQLRAKQQRVWMVDSRIVSRPFDIVIVDEVDNLFIDSALQSARSALPSLKTMAWVYSPILAFVKVHQETIENGLELLSGEDGELSDVIKQLRVELSSLQNGQYQKEVEDFTDVQLKTWLATAYQAQYVSKENQNYVIKHKKNHLEGMKDSLQITIVDWNNTGRLKEKSRWEGGLHQFIEAKHGLDIQEESVTIASLCHPVYFNYYQKIFGLTGTLGTEIERREVELTYSIDSFDVPPHRKCLRQQLDPLFARSQAEHFHLIFKEIQEIQQDNRPILILCETIQKSIDLSKYLDIHEVFYQLLNERQPEQEDFIVARAGEPRMVTIATNTGGRGTDIIPHLLSREKGGLHVVFAFFADNERVEEQGFGRGGRQGHRGSCRLILQTDKNLDLLLRERNKFVKQASSNRIRNIANAKLHHHFLANFWSQLQEFYNIPPEQFDLRAISKWLQLIQMQTPLFHKRLLDIEELIKAAQDPYQEKTSILRFVKEIQSSLGMLAQQAWAYFFYGKLDNSDDKLAIQESYGFARHFWEDIFQIPKVGF